MLRNVIVPTTPPTRSRSAALFGLVAVAIASAGNAEAACTDWPPQTFPRPDGWYVCYPSCVVGGSGATVLRQVTYGGKETITSLGSCRAECNRTAGCTSFVWHDFFEKGVQFVICTLYGNSSSANNERRPDDGASGRSWVACHRRPSDHLWREPDQKIDTERLQQDMYRPNLPAPGPGLPKKP